MQDNERGQVTQTAAQIYDEFFVPALFQEWTPHIAGRAQIKAGQTVLDVACGTGVLARKIAKYVGVNGTVIGLDVNEGMLDVARQKAPHIRWQHGIAEDLPFDNNYFDAVVSQFGLMFFENRQKAISEMLRVLRSNQRLVIAVWGELEETTGYSAMVQLLLRLFGEDAANGLRAPYNLGNLQTLQALFDGLDVDYEIETLVGKAKFPSIADWMFTDIKGWVLADSISDEQYQTLLNEAEKELQSFTLEDGRVEFDAPAHIITIVK